MVIKIDRATLPEDGQRVKFLLYPKIWMEGTYSGLERLFRTDDGKEYCEWIVHEWEVIN